MYVESLVLNEFRAIARSEVEFIHPLSPLSGSQELPNINLLVGTNGGGKSTVLKAIAAAALAGVIDLDHVTGGSIREWPRIGATGQCYAELTFVEVEEEANTSSAEPGTKHISTEWVSITPEAVRHSHRDEPGPVRHPALSLFGYGPLRLVAPELDPNDALDPTSMIANLFESSQHLYAPEAWLPDLTSDEIASINALMPPDTVLTGELRDGQIEVENRGLEVARGMLSDGIQSYMAWVLDLIFRLLQLSGSGDFRAIRGTVLVDEIDQRMHPRWQQAVLQRLTDGLPRLQFIGSAHSPLLAGGLRPENLTLLEPDYDAPGEGAMKASHLSEDIFGQTVDGVLTSSYFSLSSTRSEAFRQELRRLADAAGSIDQAAVDFIRMLTAGSTDDIHVRSEIVRRPDRLRSRRR